MIKHSSFSKFIFFLLVFSLWTAFAFAQSGAAKQVVAISYPKDKEIKVPFRGNPGFNGLTAIAKIKREPKKGTNINIEAKNLPQVFDFGSLYTTYVLWAIGTDGVVNNLGEMKSKSKGTTDGRLESKTNMETFALIVTAEPHKKVRKPSDKLVLENQLPGSAEKNFVSSLSISYNYNDSDYFRDPNLEDTKDKAYRKIPLTVLGARQAVRLASYVGAEFNAEAEYNKAVVKLEELEKAWSQKQNEKQIDYLAEQTMELAVEAERKAEISRKEGKQSNEQKRLNQELDDAKLSVVQYRNTITDLQAAIEKEKKEKEICNQDLTRIRTTLAETRNDRDSVKEQLRAANEANKELHRQIARLEERILLSQTIPELKQFFSNFGTVKSPDPQTLTIILPESIWQDRNSSEFSQTAMENMFKIFSKIAEQKNCNKLEIFSYSDDNGTAADEGVQLLTDERAEVIAKGIIKAGMDKNKIKFEGLVSLNPTPPQKGQNRFKNRRTEITLNF